MSAITAIAESLDARLEVIRDEMGRLQEARHILAPPTPRVGNQKPRKRSRRRTAKANGQVTEATILGAIGVGKTSAAAIAREFGASPNVVRDRLAELEAAGMLTHTGERSQRKWMRA